MSLYSTTPGTLIVALDIGKNVHWFGAYRYEGRLIEVVAPLKVRSDTAGFARFTATVDPLLATGRFPAALFGNEHTGVYHEPWAWLIHAHYLAQQPSAACPITYRWLNPLLTKKRQEGTSVRQHTSDRPAVVAVVQGHDTAAVAAEQRRAAHLGLRIAEDVVDGIAKGVLHGTFAPVKGLTGDMVDARGHRPVTPPPCPAARSRSAR